MSRRLFRWNKETQSFEELFRPPKARPSVAPAIHCDDIIGGEYRDTTGKVYYSRKEMMRDLEAAGSTFISASEARNPQRQKIHEVDDWEDVVEKTYYDLRDGRAPGLSESEKAELKKVEGDI